jgi:hypothetical protein
MASVEFSNHSGHPVEGATIRALHYCKRAVLRHGLTHDICR